MQTPFDVLSTNSTNRPQWTQTVFSIIVVAEQVIIEQAQHMLYPLISSLLSQPNLACCTPSFAPPPPPSPARVVSSRQHSPVMTIVADLSTLYTKPHLICKLVNASKNLNTYNCQKRACQELLMLCSMTSATSDPASTTSRHTQCCAGYVSTGSHCCLCGAQGEGGGEGEARRGTRRHMGLGKQKRGFYGESKILTVSKRLCALGRSGVYANLNLSGLPTLGFPVPSHSQQDSSCHIKGQGPTQLVPAHVRHTHTHHIYTLYVYSAHVCYTHIHAHMSYSQAIAILLLIC